MLFDDINGTSLHQLEIEFPDFASEASYIIPGLLQLELVIFTVKLLLLVRISQLLIDAPQIRNLTLQFREQLLLTNELLLDVPLVENRLPDVDS